MSSNTQSPKKKVTNVSFNKNSKKKYSKKRKTPLQISLEKMRKRTNQISRNVLSFRCNGKIDG